MGSDSSAAGKSSYSQTIRHTQGIFFPTQPQGKIFTAKQAICCRHYVAAIQVVFHEIISIIWQFRVSFQVGIRFTSLLDRHMRILGAEFKKTAAVVIANLGDMAVWFGNVHDEFGHSFHALKIPKGERAFFNTRP